MKNILDSNVKQEILKRIDALTANTKAVWGKMNVNQGLRHMSMAFDIGTGILDPTPARVPPMPKWLMKFFLLYVKPPKERAETFLEMNMVANKIDPKDFEAEKNNLKKKVLELTPDKFFIPENKIAGKFSRTDWGKLAYNHTDHHLRQFGA